MSTPSSSGHAPQGGFALAEAARLWRQSAAQQAQFFGPATTLMLDLANLQEGSHVLDVAADTGEQSLLAAQRPGASGRLLAVDLASRMLEEAAASARAAGIGTVDTQVMDAQHLELEPASFDAVISRIGVMLVPDPGAVFAGVWRVLKPEGKFEETHTACWRRRPRSDTAEASGITHSRLAKRDSERQGRPNE